MTNRLCAQQQGKILAPYATAGIPAQRFRFPATRYQDVTPTHQGSVRLFQVAGIYVFLHWSWFVVAIIEINHRAGQYSSVFWNVLEYLALFLIVLIHEFGHALACRQVGGQANQIVLWPLGGVAYVSPPARPGATLWSIAAGPLVNVALVPILALLLIVSKSEGWNVAMPDAYALVRTISIINLGLLVFNLLPIYPLDGGQILRALLWFPLGRIRSLKIAAMIGFVGVAGLIAIALWLQSIWIGIIAAFVFLNCRSGLLQARALARAAEVPRRDTFACPVCKTSPPNGPYWICGKCRNRFDPFATPAVCPHCQAEYPLTPCLDCGASAPRSEWAVVAKG